MPQSWDMGRILLLSLPPTASAGFEPANSGSSGQYANHQTTEAVYRVFTVHWKFLRNKRGPASATFFKFHRRESCQRIQLSNQLRDHSYLSTKISPFIHWPKLQVDTRTVQILAEIGIFYQCTDLNHGYADHIYPLCRSKCQTSLTKHLAIRKCFFYLQ